MNNQELLEILYAERARIESKYQMPGWSKWAIIAAIFTLAMQIIDLILTHSINYLFSLAISYFLIDLIILLALVNQFTKHNIPIFGKSSETVQCGILVLIVLFIAQIYWLIKSFTFIPFKWTVLLSTIFTVFFSAIYICAFVIGFYDTPKKLKNDKISFLYPIMLLFPMTLYAYYIYQNKNIAFLKENIHMGIYCFATLFLVLVYINEYIDKLKKIDSLIDIALYDNNYDVQNIMKQLESITIGIRFSKYLIKEQEKYIKYYVDSIISIDAHLNLLFNREQDYSSNKELIDSGIHLSHDNAENLRSILNYLTKMLKLFDNKYNNDQYKNELKAVITNNKKFLEIHDKIYKEYLNKSDLRTFAQFFIEQVGTKYAPNSESNH